MLTAFLFLPKHLAAQRRIICGLQVPGFLLIATARVLLLKLVVTCDLGALPDILRDAQIVEEGLKGERECLHVTVLQLPR